MEWACGVTTVPERIQNGLTESTLSSLQLGGVYYPRLFIDGPVDWPTWKNEPSTIRPEPVGIHANWVMAMMELYFRYPDADRYVIFQDDIFVASGLRDYLEDYRIPEHVYLNLFTSPKNTKANAKGFYPAKHRCHGAYALVFPWEAMRVLMSTRSLLRFRPGHRKGNGIDIVVAMAMKQRKFRPFVHNPSLVSLADAESTIGHRKYPNATTFKEATG